MPVFGLVLEPKGILENMKSDETLLKYCFWDNFISSKKLNKMLTKTGDKVKDDLNKVELFLLAERIKKKVVKKKNKKINFHHFLTLLDGSNKLTKRKKRRVERMVRNYCMEYYDRHKCKTCGQKRIKINVGKNYMKMIGKKVPVKAAHFLWKVKIVSCDCGEYLKMYSDTMKKCYTKKL